MPNPQRRPSLSGSDGPVAVSETDAMRYEVRKAPGLTEIALKGRMTFSDHRAFQEMMAEFDAPVGHQLVFNLSKLESVDSSGLGMLLIAGDEAKKKSLQFRIESPKAEVRRVIDLGKLDRVFDIRP